MTLESTLAERGARYGDFTDHARPAQALQNVMRAENGWERLSDVQKQALTVIADKIARILSGDPNYADSWHDIQGYAKLAEDRIVKTTELLLPDWLKPGARLFVTKGTYSDMLGTVIEVLDGETGTTVHFEFDNHERRFISLHNFE